MKVSSVVGIVASAAAVVAVAVAVIAVAVTKKAPSPEVVKREFTAYVETLAPAGWLVLVEGRERLVVRDTVKGQLFGNTMLGEFLKIRSDAVIEVEAWADTLYGVRLEPAAWSFAVDPRPKRLSVSAPALEARTPAILTETITVRLVDKSILVNEAKVAESMKAALTARFIEYAASRAGAADTQTKATDGLRNIVMGFLKKADLVAEAVDVTFGR